MKTQKEDGLLDFHPYFLTFGTTTMAELSALPAGRNLPKEIPL
jgi:hypothetical protein